MPEHVLVVDAADSEGNAIVRELTTEEEADRAAFLEQATAETNALLQQDAEKEVERQSALAKLQALGLTEAEALALVGA